MTFKRTDIIAACDRAIAWADEEKEKEITETLEKWNKPYTEGYLWFKIEVKQDFKTLDEIIEWLKKESNKEKSFFWHEYKIIEINDVKRRDYARKQRVLRKYAEESTKSQIYLTVDEFALIKRFWHEEE